MMTIDKAFKLGFAFGKGYRYSLKKRGMAMDSWVTLQNKEGENYRVNLPGENPDASGKKSTSSGESGKRDYKLKDKHVLTHHDIPVTASKGHGKGKMHQFIHAKTGRIMHAPDNMVTLSPDGNSIVGYNPNNINKNLRDALTSEENKKNIQSAAEARKQGEKQREEQLEKNRKEKEEAEKARPKKSQEQIRREFEENQRQQKQATQERISRRKNAVSNIDFKAGHSPLASERDIVDRRIGQVAIINPLYEIARSKMSAREAQSYKYLWLPEKDVTIHNGKVQGVPAEVARKHNLYLLH